MKPLSKRKILPFQLDDIIVLEAVRAYAENNPQIKSKAEFYKKFIRSNKDVFVTEHFLKSCFKLLYGKTVMQIIYETRMKKAGESLVKKKYLPIKDIAKEAGYTLAGFS